MVDAARFHPTSKRGGFRNFLRFRYLQNDRRSRASIAAETRALSACECGNVLGLGGGPSRAHRNIVNLNIEAAANVDVVGDGHRMPFLDASFDGAHCEAVFEHLHDPNDAAAELFRVMKPGAIGYICTPFMQPFHGYPSHFQNFTQMGHAHLFERAGFQVIESGACVGPAWTVAGIVLAFISTYAPRLVRFPALVIWALVSAIMIRPLDWWLSDNDRAHILASTTYVLIRR